MPGTPASDLQVPSGLVGNSYLIAIMEGLPLSAHDQQTICDRSLLIWRFTSASTSRRFSELAVFDARLYIRVRRIDEPA